MPLFNPFQILPKMMVWNLNTGKVIFVHDGQIISPLDFVFLRAFFIIFKEINIAVLMSLYLRKPFKGPGLFFFIYLFYFTLHLLVTSAGSVGC